MYILSMPVAAFPWGLWTVVSQSVKLLTHVKITRFWLNYTTWLKKKMERGKEKK